MKLNSIQPNEGARKNRVRRGRGIGCGLGKTCGRGHKGQRSRSGGYHKIGFEGGQMPIQRRIPKFGFSSRKASSRAEVTLRELGLVATDVVDLAALHAGGIVGHRVSCVKVILSGEINKALTVKGLRVTPGAQKAIEAAGGKVEA